MGVWSSRIQVYGKDLKVLDFTWVSLSSAPAKRTAVGAAADSPLSLVRLKGLDSGPEGS